jgi:type VI secretion system protein ImpK
MDDPRFRDRDSRRPRRPPRRPDRHESSEGSEEEFEDQGDEDWNEDEPVESEELADEEPRARRRGPAPPARGRSRPAPRVKGPSIWQRLGLGGTTPRRSRGLDWSEVDEEQPYEEEQASGERDDEGEDWEAKRRDPRRRPSRRPQPRPARRRLSLMELCMPLYGYATMLPGEASAAQPDYDAFRKEILAALQRIERDAPEHGVEEEDAREASYALSLFLDEQVVYSEWQGKSRWSAEPLHIVLHRDAEGGENFYRRLEELSNRQKAVKEVYLVCLALGYRGKYADLDPAQQAARIGEIRQKILRSIHPVPLDKQPVLFPDAYRSAAPVTDAVPPAPRWWVMASGATILAVLILWLILFWVAGWLPRAASERLRQVQFHRPRVETVPAATAATPVPEPTPEAGP